MIPVNIDKSYLPHKPGIYLFKDPHNQVLYVGKAIDLYSRVSSYFAGSLSTKTTHLLERVSQVETIVVESELEALILEVNLIKRYLPAFNVRLTDDKDYLYVAITKEDFPRIITARKKDLSAKERIKKYFGPFPSSRTVRQTLKQLRKVFPWCTSPPKTNFQSRLGNILPTPSWKARACFYYHLGLCSGPCVGAINQEDYRKIISRFAKFLSGQKNELLKELGQEMKGLADILEFEEAQQIKRVIDGINYLTQPNRTALYLENPNFLAQENRLALDELQKVLNLNQLPERIEAYDISNIQGKQASGSMVVLTDGDIDKSQYRRFKIRVVDRANDVGMLKEMVKRRLTHLDWPLPQLMLVDGGRGQAKAVKLEIRNNIPASRTKFEIPVFGLAKRMEWLYPPEGEIIKLSKRSLSLRLLQKIRDESHRFALAYHRKLRQKTLL